MFAACNSVPLLCRHYEQDLSLALSLAHNNPGRLLVAKYEEIVSSPNIAIPIIFKVENKNFSREINIGKFPPKLIFSSSIFLGILELTAL